MGFDRIDRQFRPKPPIKLECQWCQSTDDSVKARKHPSYEEPFVICDRCAGQFGSTTPMR